jgi:hypothetical protein
MAKYCVKCEKKIGLLETVHDGKCSECHEKEIKEANEKERMEQEMKQAEERGKIIQKLRERIYSGEKVYLYKKVFKQVDSIYDGSCIYNDFSSKDAVPMGSLVVDGINGWELVGTIPVTNTKVFKQRNQDGSVANIAGATSVAGAWIIMRIEMTSNEMFTDEELVGYIDVLV